MTDCMNMEFYRELYVSRSLKKREKRIIEGLKKKRFRKDLYLIVLAQGKQNPLEFFSVLLLKQHIFEDAGLFVVGLADGYEGALELQDVYQKTNDVRLREFILNNQKQSGEGSV